MTYNFTIEGETPSKKNNVKYSKYGTYKTKRFKDWHKNAMFQMQQQQRPVEPLDCELYIRLVFVHGDFVRRDSDNGCSSIMDLLMDCGVLKDDNWKIVREIKIMNEYSKGNSRCEIIIQAI